jgi:hypothetical protein
MWRKIISIFGIILKFRVQHQFCVKKCLSLIYCHYKISLNFTIFLSKNVASHEEKATPGNNGSKERVMTECHTPSNALTIYNNILV